MEQEAEQKIKRLAELIEGIVRVINDLEDKVYKLEEIALDGRKVEITNP